jgi:CHAT domain-containing protein/tetratricopeptide (TPR) repeat protein
MAGSRRLAGVSAAWLLAAALALACPSLAVAEPPATPADTTDAGILAAVRAQIQGGAADRALGQITPLVVECEHAGLDHSARYERLLRIYAEALGKANSARVDSAGLARTNGAVGLSGSLYGPRSLEASGSLLNLGRCLLRMGQAREARAFVDSAVAIRRGLLGPDAPDLAAALVVAGRAARETDDPDGAERCTDEVYAIRSRTLPPDHLDLAAALNNRALARRMRGDFTGAYEDGLAAVAIYEKKLPPTHINRILAYKNCATSAMFLGDPIAGIDGYRKSIDGYERCSPVDSGGVAQVYDELGLAYKDLGDFDRALESHRHARELLEGMASPDSLSLRNTHVNHGETLRSRGDLAEARAEFGRALAIERAHPSASSEAYEAIDHDLGLVARQEGRPDSAVTYLTRALALREKRTGEDGLASLLLARGLAEHDGGALDSSRADLARAGRIARRTLGPSGILVAAIGMYEAQLEAEAGDSADAFAYALACEDSSRVRARQVLRYVSERQALSFERTRPQSLDLVLSLAVSGTPDPARLARAWDCLIRSRALVLDEFAARQAEVRHLSGGTTAALEQRRYAARQRVANLVLRRTNGLPDAATANALASAANEVEAAELALAQVTRIAGGMGDNDARGLADVLGVLRPGTALVGTFRWNRATQFGSDLGLRPETCAYGAFVAVGGAKAPAVVDLGPAVVIDSLVKDWRNSLIAGSLEAERAAGARLAAAVWDPVRARMAGAHRVDLVTDGSLNDVSWYALPTAHGRLLDDDLEIHLRSSERDLLGPEMQAAGGGPVLVFGAPDFESSPGAPAATPLALATFDASTLRSAQGGCDALSVRRFGALPFAAREVEGVGALARRRFGERGVTVVEGPAATEREFIDAAPQASWIHAATHGFFIDASCRHAEWGNGNGLAGSAALDPLLYSGIALAGANRHHPESATSTDGILTADECASLDLPRVRGMVITGCDTGLGDYVNGEGVFGLRRALERAGVRSLTLALWPIDDQVAARWSLAFYDGLWRHGHSPARSGRDAMRQVRSELQAAGLDDAPRRWGGLVVSGP